jgi:RNA polymerase sigma-70 factor (ECF subfamily)
MLKPERRMPKEAPPIQQIIDELGVRPLTEERFQLLFEHYYPRLLSFFSRRGLSREDSLDLIQETFIGIYKGIGSFRRQAQFETWLFEIAINAYRKMLRRRGTQKRGALEVPLDRGKPEENPEVLHALASSAQGPDEEILGRERSRRLREAITGLPRQMRRCLVLRLDQDLKYREIAVVMRLSVGAVKVHLFEARLRLQKELGPDARSSLSKLDSVES